MTITIIPKYHKMGQGFSRQEKAESLVHPGRRVDGTQSAATWLGDLASLKKIILLCSYCRVKFNPRRNGYRKFYTPDYTGKTDGYATNGMCDACKQPTMNTPGGGTSFVSEDTYHLVCVDPIEQRRRARLKSATAWKG